MALGVLVVVSSLVVLISHGLQIFLGHNEGRFVVLLFVGAAVSYLGALVRRRANVMRDRQSVA